MAAKLLLCVSGDRATAGIWQQRKLQTIRTFDNSQNGLAAFATYLRGVRGLPVRVMVDTIDEDYRLETLPHASGGDRTQLTTRKLRQLYRATPFAAWQLQDKVTGKRREDRYLFAAITNAEVLLPWLRIIEESRLPVAGIYPLPMVTLSVIERLKLKQPDLLIISKNSAGLRQTFCKNLKFRISRLTAPRDGSAPADAYYAEEIGNTRMYLDALTVTHVDDTVTVFILDQDDSLGGIPEVLARERPNMQCVRIGREEIAAKLAIPLSDFNSSPDVLHLHLLANATPGLNLAPPRVGVGFQVYRLRHYVYAGAGAVFGCALLWAGISELRVMGIKDDILDLGQQVQQYQARYKEVTAQFPRAPASAEELHDTVEAAQRIRGELRTPEDMLIVVSRALDVSPDVSLRQVEWRFGSFSRAQEGAVEPTASAAGKAQQRQWGVVSAEVVRVAQDHRAVLERIQGFAASIAGSAQVEEVRVLKLPMDITSASTLSGTTAETARPPQAEFEVLVVFRVGV